MRHPAALLCLCIVLASSFLAVQRVAAQTFSVLVFSKTEGFRHASIPDGIAAIQAGNLFPNSAAG